MESSIVIQLFNCSSMGTRFDFLTYNVDEDFFSSTKNFILNELERIEYKYSISVVLNLPTSKPSKISDQARSAR